MNSPTPGTPQTAHKAWAGGVLAALAPLLNIVITGLLTGVWPTPDDLTPYLNALWSALITGPLGYYAVWRITNRPK